MKARLVLLVLAGALASSVAVSAQDLPQTRGLHPLQADVPGVGEVLYAVSVPDGYRPSTPAPLVLVLHPGGERPRYYGAQFTRRVVEPALRQLKPIMIAPDCPARNWSDPGCEKSVMTLLADAMRVYNIDRKRVLVVGYSMGGHGTWYMASRHQDVFTAAIPMAASTRDLSIDQLGRQATYVVHSRADEVVPFAPAEKIARGLKKLGRNVQFEAVDDLTHFDMASYVDALRVAGRWVANRWKEQDLSPVALAKGDWPQILGPTRNGIYTGPEIVPSFPRTGPPQLWSRNVGAGFAGPAVASDRLILFHRVNNRETVEAMDALTGKTIWTFDYATSYRDDFGFDEGPRAVPVIAGDRVFTHGADGWLHGIDFKTGKMLWSSDTRKVFDAPKGYFGVASSPVVDANRVLVNVGGKSGGIVAFDAASGKTVWTATADEPSYSAPIIAEVTGQHTAVFFTRTGLVALDPSNGQVRYQYRWRARQAASVNAATPIIAGDRIFLSASYGTGAVLLQVANNAVKPIWSGDESMSNHYSTSVLKDGYLYGFDGRQEFGQTLRCVELATGKVMWNVDGFGAGTLIVAGETLVITRESGELALAPASPKGFRFAARAQLLTGVVRAYPALANGRYFVRNDRQLAAFDLRK